MLDVHPPHEPVHGIRDFLLHILTITIGLLIALGLEGLVGGGTIVTWRMRPRRACTARSRRTRAGWTGGIASLLKDQEALKNDLEVLRVIAKTHKPPEHSSLDVHFSIRNFKSVGWRTAQASGALSYMPYATAQQYAEIYQTQVELNTAEQQAARDAIVALGPLMNADESQADPTGGQAQPLLEKVQIVQGQLFLVEILFKELNQEYGTFLSEHSE